MGASMSRFGQAGIALATAVILLATACTDTTDKNDTGRDDKAVNTTLGVEPTQDFSLSPSPASKEAGADDPEALPTSYDLIIQAEKNGSIDHQEALAYRILAEFGDPRLPDAYVGARGGHDLGAVQQALRDEDVLREQVWDVIGPYLLRPTHPDSAYARPAADLPALGDLSASGSPSAFQARTAQVAASVPAGKPTCDTWTSLSFDPAPYRLWACADAAPLFPGGEEPGDFSCLGTDAAINPDGTSSFPLFHAQGRYSQRICEMLLTMSLEEPFAMPAPIPDIPGDGRHGEEDAAIDIYVVDPGNWAPERGATHVQADGSFGGRALPTTPLRGTGSSAYLVISRADAGTVEEFLGTVAHEVFHAQQFGQHRDMSSAVLWWYEATAAWAEQYYVPEVAGTVHHEYLPGLQSRLTPLDTSEPEGVRYYAYLWPLYMQQESAAGIDAIFATFRDLNGVEDALLPLTLRSSIQEHTPFTEHFPVFTRRLFNELLPGNPVGTRFEELAPAMPNIGPDLQHLGRRHQVGSEPVVIDYGMDPATRSNAVPGLAWRFDQLQVASSQDGMFGLLVHPKGGLRTHDAASVQLFVKGADQHYRLHDLALDEETQLCNVSEAYVILANSSAATDDLVSGALEFIRSPAPECDMRGGLSWEFSSSSSTPLMYLPFPSRAEMHVSGVVTVKTGPSEKRTVFGGESVFFSEVFYPDAGSTSTVSGRMVHYRCERFDLDDCFPIIEQDFHSAPGPVADLEVVIIDDLPVLRVRVPVTIVEKEQGFPPSTWEREWQLTCQTDQHRSVPEYVHRYQDLEHLLFGPQDSLVGLWGSGHESATFECVHQWASSSDHGSTGSAQFSLFGEVTVSDGRG